MTANGVYSVLKVPRKATAFPLMEGYRESLEQERGLSRLLRNSSGSSADLLDQLNGQVVPCSGSLDCHWKEDVGVCQFSVFGNFVDCCFVGCCGWMCWLSLEGLDELDRVDQTTCVDATDWSERNLMLSGRRDCWSWSVDAAKPKREKVPASEHS